MINTIDYYLKQTYPRPPCFGLVTEFYLKEFNFEFKDFDIQGKTVKEVQTAFTLSILKNKLFKKIEKPVNGAIALMFLDLDSTPDHAGIFIENRILHAYFNSVIWEDVFTLKDVYSKIEFGVLNVD